MNGAKSPGIEPVYICYHHEDIEHARNLVGDLERSGIPCWMSNRDIEPGRAWGEAISEAIDASRACILLISAHSAASPNVLREVSYAVRVNKTLIPIVLEDYVPSPQLPFLIDHLRRIDATGGDFAAAIDALRELLGGTPGVIEASGVPRTTSRDGHGAAKGYVFISYVKSDADFVEKLRGILESRRYGYWDYFIGNRDYHGILYRELEERIDGAAAFMTIVSDSWRRSDWVASEFIYAREAKIPIFVIQAKKLEKPLPILLNLQTRIDMSADFEQGARTLAEELAKKGL